MPEPAVWLIVEKDHEISGSIHAMINTVNTKLTGESYPQPLPLEIPKDQDINLKAILMHENAVLNDCCKMLKSILMELEM